VLSHRRLICLRTNSAAMDSATDPDLAERLARLEHELRELKLRVIALERMLGAGELHPADSSTVQKKVTYDWQT
jgi:hypothetical protein